MAVTKQQGSQKPAIANNNLDQKLHNHDSNNLQHLINNSSNNNNKKPQENDNCDQVHDKSDSVLNHRGKKTDTSNATKTKTTTTTITTTTTTNLEEDDRLSSGSDKQNNGLPNENKARQEEPESELNLIVKFSIDFLLLLIKSIIFIYSCASQPIYYFKHKIADRKHEIEGVQRSLKAKSSNNSFIWRQINIDTKQLIFENKINAYITYDSLIRDSILSFKDRVCYGYRKVLHEHWVKKNESDTRLIRQVALSEYNWVKYDEFERQIEATRRGFLLEGIRSGDKVIIYSDTRPEWQISSQALIRIGAIVVTMYSTLGVDGIVHCVNETGVKHILAQKDKVCKLLKLKAKLPKVKKIIYFSSSIDIPQIKPTQPNGNASPTITNKRSQSDQPQPKNPDFEHPEVEFTSFNELLMVGAQQAASGYQNQQPEVAAELKKLEEESDKFCAKRTRDTIAVIMYTSGSTGIPKGVLITHGNIMSTIKSFSYVTKDFVHRPLENSCTAYLPLAHIFEFCIQSTMLFHGVKFGYGTPHTLTDKSPGLIQGQKGDLGLLQPTVMIIVPLVLDRVAQGIKQALKQQSYFKEKLITYLIEYKMYWQKRYYETPLVDKLICSKIAVALGGKARYVICGSAPLSGATQTFVKAALNIKLPQGFGTTETCAATTCQLFDDQTTENVGIPVAGCYIKLEPWYEANYSPNDRPNPRGEIVVGGDSITAGYFNLDDQTREAFYTDSEGIRWYRTGDIGEFLPNGNLRIIDRKKDLVKLQNGEYISLGKVEATFKSNPYTDNFCAYANSHYNYIVALAPANELALRELAQQIIDSDLRGSPYASLRNNKLAEGELEERKRQIEELRDILSSYESDKLNNNDEGNGSQIEDGNQNERKMSSLSTTSTVGGGAVNERLQRLCNNKLIIGRIMNHIKVVAAERNLLFLEIPMKLLLLAEEWTEDKNLVTAAMKIRRNYIYKRYEKELEQLYSEPLGKGRSRAASGKTP